MEQYRGHDEDSWMDTEHFVFSIAGTDHQIAIQNTARKEADNQTNIQNSEGALLLYNMHR